jgi:hypothetical protein
MGTIKLEIDIPDFDREINIELTIRKDGEVIYRTSPSEQVKESSNISLDKKVEQKVEKMTPPISNKDKLGGNLMNLDF